MLEICAICATTTTLDIWGRGRATGWNAADQRLEVFTCKVGRHGGLARHVVRKREESSCRVVLVSCLRLGTGRKERSFVLRRSKRMDVNVEWWLGEAEDGVVIEVTIHDRWRRKQPV